ncbi:MAG: RagB/SusD family nutrient uptake outer membrane protein [Bacteroidales bacterium]
MKIYMKPLAYIVSITILLTSCSDIFDDLAINPSQPSMGAFFTSPEAVNAAVMTCYGYIQTQRCFGAAASKTTIIRSDEASSNSDYGRPGMYDATGLNSSYYTIMQPFGLLYSTASQASYIIENIDAVEFSNEALKNAYKGEAHFWRAFAHYYLLISYRQVSPIRTQPQSSADYVRPYENAEDVWAFISADLQEAKNLLPNSKDYWTGNNKGRVTAGAAAALRGKCFLYRSGIETHYGNNKTTFYTEAANEFDEIIKGNYGSYTLGNYAHNFDVANENNNEAIFEIQFLGDVINSGFNPGSATSGVHFDSRGIMLPGAGVGYEGVVHDWLYNTFANSIDVDGYTDIRMFSTMFFNDLSPEIKLRPNQRLTGPGGHRFEEMYPNGDFSSAGNTRAHVYKAAFLKGLDISMPMRNNNPTNLVGVGGGVQEYIYNQPRAHGVNWRYIRYADVLLMYAEAVLMGGTQGSLSPADAYNQVRTRANMPTKGAIAMSDIKAERILEFALEGHRFFDLLRWGELPSRFADLEQTDTNFKRFISDIDYQGFMRNKHEWLPIPIDEITSNSNAIQNPGY